MTCYVCDCELRQSTPEMHVRELSPFPNLCLGCFEAHTELEKFLLRATIDDNDEGGRTVMGDWTTGWLREIIKNPERYRGMRGDDKSVTPAAASGHVWVVFPSKRPPAEARPVIDKWLARGYRVAIQRDTSDETIGERVAFGAVCDAPIVELPVTNYRGYAAAMNFLIAHVLLVDPGCNWIVAGADDTWPDPDHNPAVIAKECSIYFAEYSIHRRGLILPGDPDQDWRRMSTFGVMQPTGDRDFGDAAGPYVDRVASSPWIGREFARRVNKGRGVFCEEYFHMGCDEHLQEVAIKLGVFWQWPQITHMHMHWGRPLPGEKMGHRDRMPKFLERANDPDEWQKYKAILERQRAAGFADWMELLP